MAVRWNTGVFKVCPGCGYGRRIKLPPKEFPDPLCIACDKLRSADVHERQAKRLRAQAAELIARRGGPSV
jgi:hypothetical protein